MKRAAISRMVVVGIVILLVAVAGGIGAYYAFMPAKQTSAISGTINVVAFSGFNDAALKKIAADFMAQHPGVTVNVIGEPYGSSVAAYMTAFQANQSSFDVISVAPGFMGILQPYLLDVGPYVSGSQYFPASWNSSDMIQSTMNLFKAGGAQLALPEASDAFVMYYRPSFFNNATNQAAFQQQYGYALPNPASATLTLQQLVDVANFFNGQHGSKYGIIVMSDSLPYDMIQTYGSLLASLRVANAAQYGPVTAQWGVFMSNGKLLINSTIGQQAMSTYIELVNASEGPLSTAFETAPGMFARGDAPMMLFWTQPAFYLNNANKSSIGGDWAVAPSYPGGYTTSSGTALSIFKYTKNLPTALAFLSFATSPSEAKNFFTLDSLLPFRYSVFSLAMSSEPQSAPAFVNVSNNVQHGYPYVVYASYFPKISAYVTSEFPSMYSGKDSVAVGTNKIVSQFYTAIAG